MKNSFVKNVWSKNAVVLGLLWLLLAAGSLFAWPPLSERVNTKVSGDLVNIGVDFGDDASDVPINLLIHALKAYPHARRFRLSWSSSSLASMTNLTALYDRSRRSVTLYGSYSEGDNGGRTSVAEHLRYTQVREEDFEKIVAAHKDDAHKDTMSDSNWLDDLPKYGCRRHDFSSRQE